MKNLNYSIVIFLCLLWFFASCGKETVIISSDLITKGCIPETITRTSAAERKVEIKYIYEDNRLAHNDFYENEERIKIVNPSFKYIDELVVKTHATNGRYEEYYYNDNAQIIRTRRYVPVIGGNLIDGFTIETVYEYEEDKIIQMKNVTDNTISNLSYYPNSNNIDSIKTYNRDAQLIKIEAFEYDEFKNPFKNLKLPIHQYTHKIAWWTPNNYFKKRTEIELGDTRSLLICTYDSKYNEDGYPTAINLTESFSSTGTISDTTSTQFNYTIDYVNCE